MGIFYGFLSHYIARRSVTEWVAKFDRDINPKGAELLVHLLEPVLDEIRNDTGETLKGFKESFLKLSRRRFAKLNKWSAK